MSNFRLVGVILTTAIVTALVVASLSSARADVPRTAVCSEMLPNALKENGRTQLSSWMTAQLAEGKTSFMPIVGAGGTYGACAW